MVASNTSRPVENFTRQLPEFGFVDDQDEVAKKPGKQGQWTRFAQILTCWIPAYALSNIGGMTAAPVQQAWREKIVGVGERCSFTDNGPIIV